MKMNKKGKGSGPIAIVLAVFLGILILIFFSGGGIKTLFDVSKFISNIPTPVWIVFGIILIFKLMGGKRK